jgi:hypothetical protein
MRELIWHQLFDEGWAARTVYGRRGFYAIGLADDRYTVARIASIGGEFFLDRVVDVDIATLDQAQKLAERDHQKKVA